MPVQDRYGSAIAGLTIAGPITRMRQAAISKFVDLARHGAHEIARDLGLLPWRSASHPPAPGAVNFPVAERG